MNANPYSPPTARVDGPVAGRSGGTEAPFFAVSVTKLAVLSLLTFGLYELYWFYKNWHCIKKRERSSILPAARALFGVFFCYACFARIRDYGERVGVAPRLSAGPLAAGWIVINLLSRLPEPWWLVSLLAFVMLLPVQDYVNRVNAKQAPNADRNSRFTAWNWFGVVIGSLWLVLAMVGTFLPEQ